MSLKMALLTASVLALTQTSISMPALYSIPEEPEPSPNTHTKPHIQFDDLKSDATKVVSAVEPKIHRTAVAADFKVAEASAKAVISSVTHELATNPTAVVSVLDKAKASAEGALKSIESALRPQITAAPQQWRDLDARDWIHDLESKASPVVTAINAHITPAAVYKEEKSKVEAELSSIKNVYLNNPAAVNTELTKAWNSAKAKFLSIEHQMGEPTAVPRPKQGIEDKGN